MPLNWSIEKCKDWQKLANDTEEISVTDALLFQTMTIGIAYVEDEGAAEEFYRRVAINEHLRGVLLSKFGADGNTLTPRPITLADCRRRIGMYTNASPIGHAQFWRKIVPQWAAEWASRQVCREIGDRNDAEAAKRELEAK